MKTSHRLALALALAFGATAAGCSSADPSTMPGGDDDPGSHGDDGSGGGSDQPRPLDVTGTYALHSTFDLASNMPGTAGNVVNTIIAATDNADDPTRWILDQILNALPDGAVKSALNFGKEVAAGFINTQLEHLAPDFVVTMIQVGHDFGDVAKHFGLNETLTLTGSGTSYTAVHTVTGVHFKLGNQEGDYAFANYHLPNVVVNDVAVTMDSTGQLTIAAHNLPLAYGRLLRLALDAVIIPALDSSAHNLNELLAHLINCQAIGDGIAGVLHLSFVAGPISGACSLGLDAGAAFVYRQIDTIDSTAGLSFGLNGAVRGQDSNGDRKIDKLQSGAWSGTLSYGAAPTPLVPASFFGERMN